MKKIFSALIVLLLMTATAHAAQPVKIARLPIIFQSTIPDEKTCAALEKRIERAIHIPLDGYLQVAEYLPPDESAKVFNEIWSRISVDRKAKLSEAMRPLAEELDADIIICPVLLNYHQVVYDTFGWRGDSIMDSNAAFELIVYDRRTDELADKKASRMHHDTTSALGTASYLAGECLDKVIAQTKLHELIRAIGK